MGWLVVAISVVVLFFRAPTVSGIAEATAVAYVSFVDPKGSSFRSSMEATQIFTQTEQSDDSPFEKLNMPWSFNMLGENTNELFVSPNGALHYSYAQPCPPLNFFVVGTCDYDTSYYNLIAGISTDLNPSKSVGRSIRSYVTDAAVEISFANVSYYNSSLSVSFRITMFCDSHIDISYDHFVSTSVLPQPTYWASGLRGGASNSYAHFTAAQRELAANEWGTPVPSVYPHQADVRTGNRFTICPVGRSWCMQPATMNINMTTGTPVSSTLLLSATLLSCTSRILYGVMISSALDTTLNNTVAEIPCDLVGNTTSLSCSLARVLALLPPGQLYVQPAWKTAGAINFTALPLEPLPLYVVNSTAASSGGSAAACSNNLHNGTCAAQPCAICTGNLTCLHTPCVEDAAAVSLSSAYSSEIFTRSSCESGTNNGSCPDTSSHDAYYTDISSPPACCLQSDMDCSGQCGGPGVTARDATNAVYCCEPPSQVDCAGVCDGNAGRDSCGTCQGTDFTGLGCFSEDDIIFNTGFADGMWYPAYNASMGSPDGMVRQLWLNVTNKSLFAIKLTLTEPPASRNTALIMRLPFGTLSVDVNATESFASTASMTLLYQGNLTEWMAKTFVVSFYRTVYPSAVYTRSISLYPTTTNCATLTSRDRCIRLPACIFCLTSPRMRILREREEAFARRLFVELVPEGAKDRGSDLQGVCGDGWFNTDCAVIAPVGFVNASPPAARSIAARYAIAAVMVLFAFLK